MISSSSELEPAEGVLSQFFPFRALSAHVRRLDHLLGPYQATAALDISYLGQDYLILSYLMEDTWLSVD